MSLKAEEVIKPQPEIFYGAKLCKEKVIELLQEVGLPNGLLPVDDIEECGRVKETGFVWFKRQVRKEYKFESIGKLIRYSPEVSGYVEKHKIKKLNGVKSKELGIWVTINEVSVSEPGKLMFKAPAGLFNTFPFSAFEIESMNFEEVEPEPENAEEAKEAAKSN